MHVKGFNFFTGSVVTLSPNAQPVLPTQFPSITLFRTGSFWGTSEDDRTGQIVREGDGPVWLVRESNTAIHTLVNERNEEQRVDEINFNPLFGDWRRVAG